MAQRPAMRDCRVMRTAPAVQPSRELDSEGWIAALRSSGAQRDAAVARLHALLVRAARFELSRRRAELSHVRGEELEDIAMQAADDALVAVLAELDRFHGASRFVTWAYKFALLEAGVRLRRRAWQGREVLLEPTTWPLLADPVAEVLTARQREVFVALALNGVPIDVLAERMTTTRGALYQVLHDARRKLRARLAPAGLVRG
jgi:RNA polymerase sigma-70 factor (ECF subfamily)